MKHLQFVLFVVFLSSSFIVRSQIICKPKDKEILKGIFNQLQHKQNKSTAELVVLTGKQLLGTPYVAHTLETKEEQLVVNLSELDCTTFAENCLAIARTIKSKQLTCNHFAQQLTQIRYRNGVVNAYPSRLHYFSDWIYDNAQKGFVRDVSKEIGNSSYPNSLNFISTHPTSYAQLKNNPKFREEIAQQEKEISSRKTYFLPKEKLRTFESKMNEGDIVGITTSLTGLDIIHVGIIVKVNGKVHFMHASSKAGKVIISENTLYEYLMGRKSATGIMVARPL